MANVGIYVAVMSASGCLREKKTPPRGHFPGRNSMADTVAENSSVEPILNWLQAEQDQSIELLRGQLHDHQI